MAFSVQGTRDRSSCAAGRGAEAAAGAVPAGGALHVRGDGGSGGSCCCGGSGHQGVVVVVALLRYCAEGGGRGDTANCEKGRKQAGVKGPCSSQATRQVRRCPQLQRGCRSHISLVADLTALLFHAPSLTPSTHPPPLRLVSAYLCRQTNHNTHLRSLFCRAPPPAPRSTPGLTSPPRLSTARRPTRARSWEAPSRPNDAVVLERQSHQPERQQAALPTLAAYRRISCPSNITSTYSVSLMQCRNRFFPFV